MKKYSALYFSVGLVVLLAIVILVFGMFFLNEKDPRETFNTFYLRFTQVSTLVLDDPVKVNGVKMGKVEDISLAGHRVVVRIRLRTDVKIPKDSEIRLFRSVMSRVLNIKPRIAGSCKRFFPCVSRNILSPFFLRYVYCSVVSPPGVCNR